MYERRITSNRRKTYTRGYELKLPAHLAVGDVDVKGSTGSVLTIIHAANGLVMGRITIAAIDSEGAPVNLTHTLKGFEAILDYNKRTVTFRSKFLG